MKFTIEDIRAQLLSISEAMEDIAADVNTVRANLQKLEEGEIRRSSESGNIRDFQRAIDLLHEDKLNVGDIVEMEADDGKIIEWRVLHIHADSDGETMAVLQTCKVIDYSVFSEPTKMYPYGCNVYNMSNISDKLNQEYFSDCADATLVTPRWIDGKSHDYWLLSEDEAGFGDESQAYDFYNPRDLATKELYERRSKKDPDGDDASWWLRTPNVASAYTARIVSTAGALYSTSAYSARGVAPACYIR